MTVLKNTYFLTTGKLLFFFHERYLIFQELKPSERILYLVKYAKYNIVKNYLNMLIVHARVFETEILTCN